MKDFSGVPFHENTKRILLLCQCFGLIPVSGLLSGKLHYKISSFKVRYSLFVLTAHFLMAVMTLVRLLFHDASFRACSVVMIYVPGFLIHSQFFKLAQDWPELMKRWQQVDENFKEDFYNAQFCKVSKSCNRLTCFTSLAILLITICEYSFSTASYYEVFSKLNKDNALQIMIENSFTFITDYVQYNPFLAFILMTINFFCMFLMNLMDLFIIVICNGMVKKFEIISSKIITSTKEESENEYYWQKVREDYNSIAALFHYLDEKLSGLVLISFASNVFYILVQLFRSLSMRYSALENIYFFVSFGMLLLRTSAVSIVAVKVNEASRLPLLFLTLQPSEFYCSDLERLINQISQDNVALTGYKFFKITRGFLFRIAGTIVTYELFLFQFRISMSATKNENGKECR